MLSNSNKTKIFTLDNKNKLIFKEILHCNVSSITTKSGCSKFHKYSNGEIVILKPDYLAIRKLIPKLKKQNCRIV